MKFNTIPKFDFFFAVSPQFTFAFVGTLYKEIDIKTVHSLFKRYTNKSAINNSVFFVQQVFLQVIKSLRLNLCVDKS